jgi:hypothetical protein
MVQYAHWGNLVGAIGLEPTTPTMSRWCSNQLSYAPAKLSIVPELGFRLKSLIIPFPRPHSGRV